MSCFQPSQNRDEVEEISRIKGADLFSEGKRGLLVVGMRIEIQEVRNVVAAYEA